MTFHDFPHVALVCGVEGDDRPVGDNKIVSTSASLDLSQGYRESQGRFSNQAIRAGTRVSGPAFVVEAFFRCCPFHFL